MEERRYYLLTNKSPKVDFDEKVNIKIKKFYSKNGLDFAMHPFLTLNVNFDNGHVSLIQIPIAPRDPREVSCKVIECNFSIAGAISMYITNQVSQMIPFEIEVTVKSYEVGKKELPPKCEHCGTKLITMAGWLQLRADAEPYTSGVEEKAELSDAEVYISAQYCPKCHKATELNQE